jgi:DNA-binding transcriptional MerR regulator
MSVPLAIESLETLDPELSKYVSEVDGKFVFDNDQFKRGLVAEREISAGLRNELNTWKGLGMSIDQIKEFAALGKTPAELSAALAANNNASSVDRTEYLKLQKELEEVRKFQNMYEEERKKVRENTRDSAVRKLIADLPDEVDKERLTSLAEEVLFGRFELNEAGDALNAVGDKLPADYLAEFAKKHGLLKPSTPGIAKPGSASIAQAGNAAAFKAAKESGDIDGAILNAPVIE